MSITPKQLGFKMPAEWEKHSSVWLAWPHDLISFPDRLEKVEKTYVEIIHALHQSEEVKLLVKDQEMEEKVRTMLTNANVDMSKVTLFQVDYADVWTRDYGPIYTKKGDELAYLKFTYDAYGEKFPELLKDNEVFEILKEEISKDNVQNFNIDFVLEGGAVETNGTGTLLTTEECLLRSRNSGRSKDDNNEILCDNFGADKVVWLNSGLTNDHTDGHIDEVARFVSPTKILCAYEDNEQDENFEILKENFEILENATDQDGNKFEVVKLPMPHMVYDDGTKAPVSYANFYIGNTVVLVSQFNDSNDAKALELIQACFPDRKVVGIDCTDLIYGGGALHCITQQEPV
ncbi:MAG: agmatine deiminase family protein [bacterium]|nr:agmatine deiminase family protein [bacterium]